MIHHLYIRNFAVIDELDLTFGSGLNLLTGETGSGKSIIVEAIGIALGERADSDTVRSGCDRALVEAVLDISDAPEAVRILTDAGLRPEDDQIVISREISKTGKSQCRINGRPATVSLLKSVTDYLVDTHGQHEHQILLKPEHHLSVLDAWCGEKITALKEQVSSEYDQLCSLRRELQQLQGNERERVRMIDLYQFQAQEISSANLSSGEEDELLADKIRLANAEKLHESASTAFELVGDRSAENCTLDSLGEAVMEVQDLAKIDPQLEPLIESLQSALYQIEDAARELRAYRDGIEFNPERLKEVEDRLDLIRTLKRKYGDSLDEIIEYGKSLADKLDALMNSEERSSGLQNEIERTLSSVMVKAEQLSEHRRQGALEFSSRIENELSGLSMPNAVFQISCVPGDLDSTGIDRVEFMISANQGELPKPLVKIASGGEMSRLMLAIKSVMAAVDQTPTLIFDEIDVGIGGRTAEFIADKLVMLSQKSQVFCITHLPQIACRPGDHFNIDKIVSGGRTAVSVRQLSSDDRVSEISRMLGGNTLTDTAIKHAREMLGLA
ncbi:MAG: DNA repair protein RecN [Armatimonadota bacterium]